MSNTNTASDRLNWLNTYKDRLHLNHCNTSITIIEDSYGLLRSHGEWFSDNALESFYQGFMACKSLMFSEQVEMVKQAYEQLQPTAMDMHTLRHQLEFGDSCGEYQGL